MDLVEFEGLRYVRNGRDMDADGGLDCYGLLMALYAKLGFTLREENSFSLSRSPIELMHIIRNRMNMDWQNVLSSDYAGYPTMPSGYLGDDREFALVPYSTLHIAIKGEPFHVAMLLEDGKFVHTWERSQCVVVETLTKRQPFKILGVYKPNGFDLLRQKPRH